MVEKNVIYLLDNEQMIFSLPGYDLAQVMVSNSRLIIKSTTNERNSLNARMLIAHLLLLKLSQQKKNNHIYISLAKTYLQQINIL